MCTPDNTKLKLCMVYYAQKQLAHAAMLSGTAGFHWHVPLKLV